MFLPKRPAQEIGFSESPGVRLLKRSCQKGSERKNSKFEIFERLSPKARDLWQSLRLAINKIIHDDDIPLAMNKIINVDDIGAAYFQDATARGNSDQKNTSCVKPDSKNERPPRWVGPGNTFRLNSRLPATSKYAIFVLWSAFTSVNTAPNPLTVAD
jgi:hypothetical protein